jgi:PhnB protein
MQLPLTGTFFAKAFGMVIDKFGVAWMVLASQRNPR